MFFDIDKNAVTLNLDPFFSTIVGKNLDFQYIKNYIENYMENITEEEINLIFKKDRSKFFIKFSENFEYEK